MRVWIKPHSSETETLRSVQVHQLTVNPSGGKSYSTRQFALFELMASMGRPGSQWYCGTQGRDTCRVAGTCLQGSLWLLESPAVLLGPHQLNGAQTSMWPLCSFCADSLLWSSGSTDTLEFSFWPSSSSPSSEPLLPPQVLSLSLFLSWGPQGCRFCQLCCQPVILAELCWKASLGLGWQHPRHHRQPATTLSSLSSQPHAAPGHGPCQAAACFCSPGNALLRCFPTCYQELAKKSADPRLSVYRLSGVAAMHPL